MKNSHRRLFYSNCFTKLYIIVEWLWQITIYHELSHLYGISINKPLEDSDSFVHLSNKDYKYDEIAILFQKKEKHQTEPGQVRWSPKDGLFIIGRNAVSTKAT